MRQLIFILSITSIFMGAIFAQGDTCGYVTVIQDGDLYRMWYRASGTR